MDIELQKEILKYFIEDTNEHLDIIQRVFASLSSREEELEERQNFNDLFRATFSIRGGVGMLGFKSLGIFLHKVEKFAKILRDHPIQVNPYLEIRFIKVCQFLKEQLYSLEPPLDWNADKTEQMVAKIEPILQEIELYLDMLHIQQHKQILNRFIENTNKHIDTIQRIFVGLSSREEKLEAKQNLNALFRATYHIKNGARKLGFNCLREFAYKVDKFANFFQDHPILVDSYLEIRFIKVCRSLKEELYSLEPPLDRNTDKTEQMVAKIEPILQEIELYLDMLII